MKYETLRLLLRKLQANPKLAERRDDDERLPIHWAVSYGHLNIAVLLSAGKNFDPDVQVSFLSLLQTWPPPRMISTDHFRMVQDGHP